jgi:guanyl-specific ribonuclease Sa
MLREVTRKVRQQIAWIASLVAVVVVLAWQLLGGRDQGGRDVDEQQRTDNSDQRRRDGESQRRGDDQRRGNRQHRRDDDNRGRPDESRRTDESREPASRTRSDAVDVPPEANETLAAIRRGGPYRYRQDGAVFQNREGHLPPQPRGYYREYTVETPGSRDRGPRRIVTGGDPPTEFFYTSDHYRSFRRIEVPR